MLKIINPELLAIQTRFFEALDLLIRTGQITGVRQFCEKHGLNRVKYLNIRKSIRNPEIQNTIHYKVIDLDALAYLCQDYHISSDWLLLGKGEMFK